MDSEHTATVTHHSGDLGFVSIPQAEAKGVSPNVSQVGNLIELRKYFRCFVYITKFKRANEDDLQHLIKMNQNFHTN